MSWISWMIAYLIGSISFSYLIAKKIAKIDIRQHGSGNAGATNTLRVLGKGPAVIVLLLDALKGMVAVGIGHLVSDGNQVVPLMAGLLAIVGHNWPLYFHFKGGKGIATTIGVMLVTAPLPTVISGVVAILTIVVFRYVSLGSLIFVSGIPLIMWLFQEDTVRIVTAILIAVLGIIRHRNNLQNLLRGTERKLGEKAASKK